VAYVNERTWSDFLHGTRATFTYSCSPQSYEITSILVAVPIKSEEVKEVRRYGCSKTGHCQLVETMPWPQRKAVSRAHIKRSGPRQGAARGGGEQGLPETQSLFLIPIRPNRRIVLDAVDQQVHVVFLVVAHHAAIVAAGAIFGFDLFPAILARIVDPEIAG